MFIPTRRTFPDVPESKKCGMSTLNSFVCKETKMSGERSVHPQSQCRTWLSMPKTRSSRASNRGVSGGERPGNSPSRSVLVVGTGSSR